MKLVVVFLYGLGIVLGVMLVAAIFYGDIFNMFIKTFFKKGEKS